MKTFLKTALAGVIALCALTAEGQIIYKNKCYQWKGNSIVQGKFVGKAVSPTKVTSNYVPIPPKMEVWNDMNPKEISRKEWNLTTDISHLPHYESDNVLDNALYNMALEESVLAIEPDSTFRTGIAWGGVWTRDVSYSIIHSLAQLHPEVAMKSLRAKVTPNNRIIQDTGTGGAWPCSTDRVIWAVAAWEVYKITGDKDWLDYIFPIIRNSLMDDLFVVRDDATGLMRGETSYMDWREQEYPQWMEPADIYSSESTVNNAVHYMAYTAMVEICKLEGQSALASFFDSRAAAIKLGMNKHLWLEDRGQYSIYLYGRRFPVLAKQSDAMGNALSILSGISSPERAKTISENVACEPFGTPCIYPNLKDQYPYHNDATWPFVQGYWMRACAKAGNEQALMHSIAALYRGAALWLSNEENYEISTGDYQLTKLNSPRQLWSVAAQAAIVPHVYFGINYEADRLVFTPFVPKALKGNRKLSGFKYRKAILDVSIRGFGTEIKEFLVDGKPSRPELAGDISGHHTVDITLEDNVVTPMKMTLVDNSYLPVTPVLKQDGSMLTWEPTEGSVKYEVLRNGVVVETTSSCNYAMLQDGEYAVCGIGEDGMKGYISAPVDYFSKVIVLKAKDFGKADCEYLDLTRNKNVSVFIPVEVVEEGDYSIDFRYSNGAGSVTTANKCATRLLSVDGGFVSTAIVFPQRGENDWGNWGYTNKTKVHLKQGKHVLTVSFTDQTENMNLEFNCAHLESVRLTLVK